MRLFKKNEWKKNMVYDNLINRRSDGKCRTFLAMSKHNYKLWVQN